MGTYIPSAAPRPGGARMFHHFISLAMVIMIPSIVETYRPVCCTLRVFLLEVLAMYPESSATDEKQRSQLLEFCLSALAFAGALVLMEYSPSPWREILRVAMIAIASFAVWAMLRFLRVADERQRRINLCALRIPLFVRYILSS